MEQVLWDARRHVRWHLFALSIAAYQVSSSRMPPLTSYTVALNEEQIRQVKAHLREQSFEFYEVAHAQFGARKGKLNVVIYKNGKCVAQGKETEDFVTFYLEPAVLKEAKLGYDQELNPEAYEPHAGVDESGKGDFFGPLVIAGVFARGEAFSELKKMGVRDSKLITSDRKAVELAKEIKKRKDCVCDIVAIGNEAYNRLYQKMRNVNDMLGWGHARVIENLLEKADPEATGQICTRVVSDQFGNERIIKNALMKRGKGIKLEQRHKAESDLAVAAASILARAEFVQRLHQLGAKYNLPFPKGASAQVKAMAVELVKARGPDVLNSVAKTHFKTAQEVIELAKS
jgi:ribonuclease HIII